jgi:putative transposase
LADLFRLIALSLRRGRSLGAENLFLRRQLALYKVRGIKPRRIDAICERVIGTIRRECLDWMIPSPNRIYV